ncbi:hypothetical protein QUF55_06550 [Clostridiaceae bacterium HSG29]|nr:hypothetical protein [Clostridiaceae bacterium HSG29]
MKKILSIGLVVVIVLGLGAMSFADSADDFVRGFGKGNHSEDFERGYGRDLSDEEFNEMRESRRQNINTNLNMNFERTGASDLASITDLTEDEIIESGLTLHEIAENENVLDEFHALIIEKKTTELNSLVENGTISQEKADFMLDRMNNADGSQLQERMGQKSSRGNGRGFRRK